jgi:hypothetical protein
VKRYFYGNTLTYPLMSSTLPPPPVLAPDTAVLLIFLPPAPLNQSSADGLTASAIQALQLRLGPAIRVLKVDEASHPAVVRSFDTPELPACVLVRQGVELWRQQGLPENESVVLMMLDKVSP